MAGPCLSVFTPQGLSRDDVAAVRAFVAALAGKVDGDDFWIAGRPFFATFGDPEPEDRALDLGGWSPQGEVAVCAMCNDLVDHILLGVLGCRTAENLGGLIALDDLTIVTSDPSVLTLDGRIVVAGRGDFATPAFLANWMASPDFRLVK